VMTSWQLRPYTYIYIYISISKFSCDASGGFLIHRTLPPRKHHTCRQNQLRGHFEARSSPLRIHLARKSSKTPRKPAPKLLWKSLGPLENTAPAVKSGLEATSKPVPSNLASRPLRSHFEPTSRPLGSNTFENTKKTSLEATFEVTWTARKHHTCHQIRP
jgi:hypothetical protein